MILLPNYDPNRSRKNGITQLKDGTEYEIQRIRRIKRKKELNRAMAAANAEVNTIIIWRNAPRGKLNP